jgi:hypothetical protein
MLFSMINGLYYYISRLTFWSMWAMASTVVFSLLLLYPVFCHQAVSECLITAGLNWIQIGYVQNKPLNDKDSKLYSGSYQKICVILILLIMKSVCGGRSSEFGYSSGIVNQTVRQTAGGLDQYSQPSNTPPPGSPYPKLRNTEFYLPITPNNRVIPAHYAEQQSSTCPLLWTAEFYLPMTANNRVIRTPRHEKHLPSLTRHWIKELQLYHILNNVVAITPYSTSRKHTCTIAQVMVL